MKSPKNLLVAAVAALLALPMSASAATIGYYLSFTGGSPAGAITAAGHTPQALAGLTAGDLAGIDVLWVLNGNNGTPDAQVTGNVAAVADFVNAGGVLSFHDRNVTDAGNYLPGGAGIAFTRSLASEIEIVTNNAVTAGLNNASLDGGNFSNHGFASLASLPAGAVPVLSTADPTQIVDFYYQFGAGYVYYSTIPLDFYLAGGGNNPPADAIRNIYAPQEAAFQASLANPVPEPASFAMIGLGLAGVALVRRRRA